MCDTLDLEKVKITVKKSPKGSKYLALATFQIMEMRVKGFVIAEGVDRYTREIKKYVTPPKATTRKSGKKPTMYFFLEDPEKWERLQLKILEEYEKVMAAPFES